MSFKITDPEDLQHATEAELRADIETAQRILTGPGPEPRDLQQQQEVQAYRNAVSDHQDRCAYELSQR